MTSHRNATLIVVVFFLALLVAVVTWLLDSPFDDQAFDQATWQSSRPRKRAKMAVDLVENHLQVGMKKIEVVELLGEPDMVRGDADLYSIGSWRFSRGGHDSTFVHVVYGTGARVMFSEVAGL